MNENRTGFLYPIMQGGRSAVCVRCLFTNNTHAQLARTGAIWVAIFLPVRTRVKNSRDSNRAFFRPVWTRAKIVAI